MPKGSGAKGALIGKAISTDFAGLESRKGVYTEISNAVNTETASEVPPVSLTIKVPLAYRQHWQIEAKRRNTSVTSLIVEALQEKLGLPEK